MNVFAEEAGVTGHQAPDTAWDQISNAKEQIQGGHLVLGPWYSGHHQVLVLTFIICK